MDDPEGTDPAAFSDLALYGAARSGSASAAEALRDRYRQALRTVAAGYRNRDTDREGLLDQVVGMLDAAPMPTTDGGVPLTLFALVRTARIGGANDHGRPTGLVELVGTDGAPSLVAGTDTARRKALLGAYASLDDRDRVLLWFSAVEGTMPKALSGRLAIGGADMASTKTFRARSHLRRAYAERRSAGPEWPAECKERAADLARRADGEHRAAVARDDDHLASCPRCTALLAELHALTSSLLDEAALVLQGVDARRVRAGRAGAAATTVVAAAAVEPTAAPLVVPEHFEPDEDEPSRGRAFAVAGVGLLVVAAIAAFAAWGAGSGDRSTHVATPGTSQVRRPVVSSPAPTASVRSKTTSTSTTRRRGTTTTSTTTRSTGTRRRGTSGSSGSGGGWIPPPSDGTATTTPVTQTAAPTTKPPSTTAAPTTTTAPTTTASTPTTTEAPGPP